MCEPAQTAAADLLPNKFHATANVSLLARLQKLLLELKKKFCCIRRENPNPDQNCISSHIINGLKFYCITDKMLNKTKIKS